MDDALSMAAPPVPGIAPMKLTSGRIWNPLAPTADGFELIDIAAGLARICRFSGHFQAPGPRPPYYVAQHSVLGAMEATRQDGSSRSPISKRPRLFALAVLLHDAAEALTGLGDVISPVKRQIPQLSEIEARVEAAIAQRFGLPPGFSKRPEVKAIDARLLATEDRDLRARAPSNGVEPMPERIVPWGWRKAERRFLQELERLTGRTS